MTNIQQPEMRRSGESPTTKQRTQDARPTEPPGGGGGGGGGGAPVPAGQVSPYGPSGKVAADAAGTGPGDDTGPGPGDDTGRGEAGDG